MGKFWWWPFGRVPEVAAEELYALIQNRNTTPVILDVRTVGEWSDSRIAGSINVPVTELKHRLPSLPLDRSRPIVAVCRSAHRSIPAVRLLQQQGFSQVCQLQGGMRSWWRAELAVEGAKVADTGK